MQRGRNQVDRSTATRRALIEAGVQCLITRGHAGLTVRTIAREAGVSPGAFQHHFDTKEGIAVAILTEICEDAAAQLTAIEATDFALDESVCRTVDALWALYGGARYIAAAELMMAARTHAGLRARIHDFRLALADAQQDLWDRHLQCTLVDPAERRHLREFVIATLEGLALQRLHDRDLAPPHPHLARLRDHIAGVLRNKTGSRHLGQSGDQPSTPDGGATVCSRADINPDDWCR